MIIQNSISDKDIERSLWYIRNKKRIKKIIIIILLITIAILYSFSIFKLIKILTQKEDLNFTSIDLTNYRLQNTPKDLTIENKEIIDRGDGKYDIVITISNPNQNIGAIDLKYKISLNDTKTEIEGQSFIMPNRATRIVELGVESKTQIRKIDISLEEIKWQKIKQNDLDNFTKNIFETKDAKANINPDDQTLRNWAEFTVKNTSPYNLKKSKFYALLYLGSKIVAINEIEQNYFKSGEERKLQSSWYYQIPSYATLEIEYATNLLDKNNYFVE